MARSLAGRHPSKATWFDRRMKTGLKSQAINTTCRVFPRLPDWANRKRGRSPRNPDSVTTRAGLICDRLGSLTRSDKGAYITETGKWQTPESTEQGRTIWPSPATDESSASAMSRLTSQPFGFLKRAGPAG